MLIRFLKQQLSIVCVALLFMSPVALAQVYKWVDANGKTHYSDKPEDAARAKAQPLKTSPPPTTRTSPSLSLEAQELEFRKRRIARENEAAKRRAQPATPVSLSGGRTDGSDAANCNLARDILNGSVKRRNGLPTDANDREIAEREVRQYCK